MAEIAAATEPPLPIVVWGSCVSRDAIERPGGRQRLLRYHARTSWISQASVPYDGVLEGVEALSPFGLRMVEEDARKNVVAEIESRRPAVLVIDLIDERFPLILRGATWWTLSEYLEATAMVNDLTTGGHVRCGPLEPVRLERFEAAARTIAPWLAARLPDTVFALHEAFWATDVRGDAELDEARRVTAVDMNGSLAQHYEVLADAFGPRAVRLRAPAGLVVADPEHRWNLAAFHYVPEYYDWLVDALVSIDRRGHVAATVGPWLPPQPRHARPSLAAGVDGWVPPMGVRAAAQALRSAIHHRLASEWSQRRRP